MGSDCKKISMEDLDKYFKIFLYRYNGNRKTHIEIQKAILGMLTPYYKNFPTSKYSEMEASLKEWGNNKLTQKIKQVEIRFHLGLVKIAITFE